MSAVMECNGSVLGSGRCNGAVMGARTPRLSERHRTRLCTTEQWPIAQMINHKLVLLLLIWYTTALTAGGGRSH